MMDTEYHEIFTAKDAQDLSRLWIPHKPGLILGAEFVPYLTEDGADDYHERRGLSAIRLKVLISRFEPAKQVEILCRNPVYWNLDATFFTDLTFDALFDRPRLNFLPHYSPKVANHRAPSRILAEKFAWRWC